LSRLGTLLSLQLLVAVVGSGLWQFLSQRGDFSGRVWLPPFASPTGRWWFSPQIVPPGFSTGVIWKASSGHFQAVGIDYFAFSGDRFVLAWAFMVGFWVRGAQPAEYDAGSVRGPPM